jgi:hypothetical protein
MGNLPKCSLAESSSTSRGANAKSLPTSTPFRSRSIICVSRTSRVGEDEGRDDLKALKLCYARLSLVSRHSPPSPFCNSLTNESEVAGVQELRSCRMGNPPEHSLAESFSSFVVVLRPRVPGGVG